MKLLSGQDLSIGWSSRWVNGRRRLRVVIECDEHQIVLTGSEAKRVVAQVIAAATKVIARWAP